jgi:hypothetical protein
MLHIDEQYSHTTYTIATPLTVTSDFTIKLDTVEFEAFLEVLEKNGVSRVEFANDIQNLNLVKTIEIRVNRDDITEGFEYDLITHLFNFSTKNYS